jgi:hypothetical protein
MLLSVVRVGEKVRPRGWLASLCRPNGRWRLFLVARLSEWFGGRVDHVSDELDAQVMRGPERPGELPESAEGLAVRAACRSAAAGCAPGGG